MVYLPKNKYSDFHVFDGSVSVRIKRRSSDLKLLTDNIQWKLRENIPKIHGGGSSSMRSKTPFTSSIRLAHKSSFWARSATVSAKRDRTSAERERESEARASRPENQANDFEKVYMAGNRSRC